MMPKSGCIKPLLNSLQSRIAHFRFISILVRPRFSTVAPILELLPCPNTNQPRLRSVHAAMSSDPRNANGAIATGLISSPYATFRKVVTGTGCGEQESNLMSLAYETNE